MISGTDVYEGMLLKMDDKIYKVIKDKKEKKT